MGASCAFPLNTLVILMYIECLKEDISIEISPEIIKTIYSKLYS